MQENEAANFYGANVTRRRLSTPLAYPLEIDRYSAASQRPTYFPHDTLMKSDRYFYSTAAALVLVIMFIGFFPFYVSGHGAGGRIIDPGIFPVVLVHGLAITAWYVLSLVQSLLIAVRNRRLHMKLGWSAVGIALVIAISGVMVAIRSVQGAPEFHFFGMDYPDFLLVMLMEIVVYTIFVAAGIMTRKRPEIHRAMMLLASLSLLLGATARMPLLNSLFGHLNLAAFFGPVFSLAAIFLVVHSLMIRAFDRWFAAGYGLMVIVYLAAEQFSHTDTWHQWASRLLKS